MELCAILLSWVIHFSDYQAIDGCPEMRLEARWQPPRLT